MLAKHEGAHTIAALRETAAEARDLLAVRRAAADGDAEADVELFVRRLSMEVLSFAEATAHFDRVRDALSDDQVGRARQMLVNQELAEKLNALRREHGAGFMRVLPAEAAEYLRAGKVPTNRLARHFFDAVYGHAKAMQDRELAELAVSKAREVFGDHPSGRPIVERGEALLEAW